MNKLFLSSLIAIFALIGCQKSEEDKVKQAVKKHIKANKAKDVQYEPVNFGELDSTFLTLEETDRYKTLTDTSRLAGKIAGMKIRVKTASGEEKAEDQEELEKLKESIQKKREELQKFVNNYDPRLKGFYVPHTYKLGDKEVKHTFEVDTSYNVVDTVQPKPELD